MWANGIVGGSHVREGRPSEKNRGAWGEPIVSEPTTIIGAPISPYVRNVMTVCDLKGVAYRIDTIIPFQGNDAFSRLSPLGGFPS